MAKFNFLKVNTKEDAEILERLGYRLVYSDGELYTFENNAKLTFSDDSIKNRVVLSNTLAFETPNI